MTDLQLNRFWRALKKACDYQHIITTQARNDYRHQIMRDECNIDSIKDANTTDHFDKLMLRLAIDACDAQQVGYFATAIERRYARLISTCTRQLMQIQGTDDTDSAAYIAGIIQQAGYRVIEQGENYWLDLPVSDLHALFMMLDTHRRRQLKRAGWTKNLAFSYNYSYTRIGACICFVRSEPERSPFKLRVSA